MSVSISPLTVEQAHKEFNSLADKIAAKYEQLDCSKFGTVGTPHLMLSLPIGKSICSYELTMSMTEPANAYTASQSAVRKALKNTFQI